MPFGLTADTGGHIAYVIDAACAQAARDDVSDVEILTRLFDDARLGPAHAVEREQVATKIAIRRLATDNRAYLEKDALADDLSAFAAAVLRYVTHSAARPDVLHAHFADAAIVAAAVRDAFGIPFVYTPHALGLDKRATGGVASDSRIAAERNAIVRADAIVVSTRDEARHQVAAYGVATAAARVHVLAPGVPRPAAPSRLELPFCDAGKPLVLSVARPVRKKNLAAVVEAFVSTPLHEVANLAILAGQWGRVVGGEEEHDIICGLRARLGHPRLRGRVFFPDRHSGADVCALYRRAARSGGLFVAPAFHEPFGLTLLEAAAAGLPVVATRNGGAAEIVRTIRHGLLVDPADPAAIGAACLRLVTDRALHDRLAAAALRRGGLYSWKTYAEDSRRLYATLRARRPLTSPHYKLLACDIDGTLTGSHAAAARFRRWADQRDVAFIVATGRDLESARSVLAAWRLPEPDAYVTDVGTRLWRREASGALTECCAYAAAIDDGWNRVAVAAVCANLGIEAQPAECQGRHKLSFFGDVAAAATLRGALHDAGLAARVVASHSRYIDVLAPGAGKAPAIGAFARAAGFDLGECVAAGDSGNDADMLERCGGAIVVANAFDDLAGLAPRPGLVRAGRPYADGVLEGLAELGLARPQVPADVAAA